MKIDAKTEAEKIKSAFLGSDDLLLRELNAGGARVFLVYLDGLTDKELLESDVIRPLVNSRKLTPSKKALSDMLYYGEEVNVETDLHQLVRVIAEGDIALVADGAESYFWISLRKYQLRAIAEPPTSSVLKGPREGFIEDLKINLTMLRRRIRSEKLSISFLQSGRQTRTSIAVVYIDGIADPEIVGKVKERIKGICIDGIVDSSYVARFLEERPQSLFHGVGTTEKPDILTAKLLEGRVAILVDGSPIALTVPYLLIEDFQDSYDYYSKNWRSTVLRLFRLIGAGMTVLLPALYVAFVYNLYHMLPLKFLVTIMNATTGIPFSPPIEMLIVLLLFEVLNQASLRMPRFLGISLSVVGAIVLGDTAVKAGLISSPAVLITALSAIGLFCVPDQVSSFGNLRLLFVCISSVLGLYGIILSVIILIAYLAATTSYGAPLLAPYAPLVSSDVKDGFLKADIREIQYRPQSFKQRNKRRERDA